MAEAALVEKVPAIGWSFQANFGGDKRPRSLVAQLHLPIDASPERIDEVLDMVRTAIERQGAFYELEEAIGALDYHKSQVRDMYAHMEHAEETARLEWEARGRHGNWSTDKMTDAQRKNYLGATQNLRTWEAKTDEWKRRVDALRGKVNGHALDRGANRDAGLPAG